MYMNPITNWSGGRDILRLHPYHLPYRYSVSDTQKSKQNNRNLKKGTFRPDHHHTTGSGPQGQEILHRSTSISNLESKRLSEITGYLDLKLKFLAPVVWTNWSEFWL